MPRYVAPKGNKFAVGAKGGRRPSVKEEIWHMEKWQEDTLIQELKDKIDSGKYSIRDRWLLLALEGDRNILKQAADKILADLHELTGQNGGPLVVKWE